MTQEPFKQVKSGLAIAKESVEKSEKFRKNIHRKINSPAARQKGTQIGKIVSASLIISGCGCALINSKLGLGMIAVGSISYLSNSLTQKFSNK